MTFSLPPGATLLSRGRLLFEYIMGEFRYSLLLICRVGALTISDQLIFLISGVFHTLGAQWLAYHGVSEPRTGES